VKWVNIQSQLCFHSLYLHNYTVSVDGLLLNINSFVVVLKSLLYDIMNFVAYANGQTCPSAAGTYHSFGGEQLFNDRCRVCDYGSGS